MREFFTNFFIKSLANVCSYLFLLVFLLLKLVLVCFTHLKQLGMRIFGPLHSIEQAKGFYIVPATPPKQRRITPKAIILMISLVIITNLVTYQMFGSKAESIVDAMPKPLYLIEKAAKYVKNTDEFEAKVKFVSDGLNIPPEWLMAVMYLESRFNPSVTNHKGSGATGLIQFMVPTVKELNVRMGTKLYMSDIQRMSAEHQLDLVYEYLQTIRERYGEFDSLTELYLGILYPKALEQEGCHTLFAKPSKTYRQNSGLDENGDGKVTICDIDKRMERIFPTAFLTSK